MTSYTSSSRKERGRRILLVEDEPFVREATAHILHNAGFEVLAAADAAEALAAYEQSEKKIDLVMSDLVLPGRSGIELVHDLRLRSREISILLTSGYGESATQCESWDVDTHYLAKPYSRQSLLEKIEQILASRSSVCAAARAS